MRMAIPSPDAIQALLGPAEKPEARSFAKIFREQAKLSTDKDWLIIAQVFDFHFRHSNPEEPFGPLAVLDGKRSMIPADLSDEQLGDLRNSLDSVSDPEFRARVGDVIWARRKDPVAARIAVEGYLQSAIRLEDPDHWIQCMERYERGVRLARSLGKTEPLAARILDHVLGRIRHYNGQDKSWLSFKALSLLYEFSHGDPVELADRSSKAGEQARDQSDLRKSGEFYALAAKFMRRAGDTAAMNEALHQRAERLVDEAEAREKSGSHLVAHQFWNNAIQAYRQVPGSGDRIRELHRRMNRAGEKMLGEMQEIGGEIDIRELVARTSTSFAGRSLDECLYLFAAISSLNDPADLRAISECYIKEHPLQAIVEAQIIDAAGRKVGVRPSAFTSDSKQLDKSIAGFMAFHASMHRGIAVAGSIMPALHIMLERFVIDDTAIERLIKDSPFVPNNRVSIFVRGFRYGFERDFSTALHLLVPQVEHSLRKVLSDVGVITTSLDSVGIEEDWALGKILSEQKLHEVLGASHLYELRSLLFGDPGANIRNLLAHGLLTDAALSGQDAVYLWWIIFRLAVMPTHAFSEFVATEKTQRQNC